MTNNNNNNTNKSGIGFCGLLTIAFIVLKLCNVITWSWVWVLAPTWIPIALVVLIIVIGTIVTLKKTKQLTK